MRSTRSRIPLLLAAVLLLPAVGARAQSGPDFVVLSFDKLAPLDEAVDGHYEGWAIVGGMPVSTGNFNVNSAGMPVELGGGPVIDEFDAGQDITIATDIKITIEPPGDADPAPSGLVIVGGPVIGASASLVAGVPNLGMLEGSATGNYVLATPSDDDMDTTNGNQGIWYLEPPGPMPGFMNLPDIGPKWTYEGWVVDVSNPGMPVPYSTGTFAMASGTDSDAAGCMGGGPPFPGQDFVAFQCGPVLNLDDGNYVTVITVEPVPDNLASPFQLKPFAAAIPTDALGMVNPLTNQALDTFPTGTAQLMSAVAVEETSWGEMKAAYR